MSKIGQQRIKLQEMPEYEKGYEAYQNDKTNQTDLEGEQKQAYLLGYHDAYYDHQIYVV